MVAFARDTATGAVSRLGCFQSTPRPGSPCTPADIFPGSDDLVTNADGTSLYLASPLEGAISAFIAPSPSTPAKASQTTAAAPPRAGTPVKAADTSAAEAPSVAALFTQTLGQFSANPCIGVNDLDGPCADGVAMRGAGGLTLSPEGNQLYAVARQSNAIDVFNPVGREGFVQTGCVMASPPPGLCGSSRFLESPNALTISPNGRYSYVADGSGGEGRIDVLARNPTSGRLSDVGCVDYLRVPAKPDTGEEETVEAANGEHEEAPKEPPDPCTSVPGLEGVSRIAISADGSNLYAFGSSSAVSFSVDASTGALTETRLRQQQRFALRLVA